MLVLLQFTIIKMIKTILKYIFSLGCLLPILGCNAKKIIIKTRPDHLVHNNAATFYEIKLPALVGSDVIDMSDFKGKKIVILNVASNCGYTDQYADWEKFYENNKDNVVVIGVPSNQFLMQERGSNEDIAQFCQLNYGVTFPMTQKSKVKGGSKNQLYQWLTNPALNGWNDQQPVWNFCKYLVDENGNLLAFFSSKIKPDNEAFLKYLD